MLGKKGALKTFAIFTGKHLGWSLFLIKLGGRQERLQQMFSCENCEIFKNIYFEEYLRSTVSFTRCFSVKCIFLISLIKTKKKICLLKVRFYGKGNTPWTQYVNWTYIRRSIYGLCLGGKTKLKLTICAKYLHHRYFKGP